MRFNFLFLLLFVSMVSAAQRVGINTPTPHASAALDVESADKGMLIPRMSKGNRTSIASPANGLMVYQNGPDSTGFYYFHNSWHYLNYDSMLPPTAMLLSASYPNPRLENNNFMFKGKLNIPNATVTQTLPVATNVWQPIDSTVANYPPTGANEPFSIWVDSVFYITGGLQPTANQGGLDFYKFNPVTKQWQRTLIPVFKMTTEGTQARVGNKWIFWGGYYNPTNNNALGAFIYDLSTNTMTQSSLPNDSSRRYNTATVVGNNIYYWGGISIVTSSYVYNTGYYYNTVANTWTKMNSNGSPAGRMHAGAVAAGTDIVYWGGYTLGGGFLSNGAIYRTTSNTWTTLSATNAPPASIEPAMAYYNNNVYIIAGSQTKMLNPTTNTWTTLAPPPYVFNGQKHVYDGNGKIFVFGGARYFFTPGPTTNGYIYDIPTNTYTALPSLGAPQARAGHAVATTGAGTWLVWSGSPTAAVGATPDQTLKSGALFYLNAQNVVITEPVGDLFLYEKK